MASNFFIRKGALPTWHDLYVANSNDYIDLDQIYELPASSSKLTSAINAQEVTQRFINGSTEVNAYMVFPYDDTPRWNIQLPQYAHPYASGVIEGMYLKNTDPKLKKSTFTQHIQTGPATFNVTRERVTGKLTVNGTTVISSNCPYILPFMLCGGGGGGAYSLAKANAEGGGGGGGATLIGWMNFTASNTFSIIIGAGGSAASISSNPFGAGGGHSEIKANNNYIWVLGGGGGDCSATTNPTYKGGPGGTLSYFINGKSTTRENFEKQCSEIFIDYVISGGSGGRGGGNGATGTGVRAYAMDDGVFDYLTETSSNIVSFSAKSGGAGNGGGGGGGASLMGNGNTGYGGGGYAASRTLGVISKGSNGKAGCLYIYY